MTSTSVPTTTSTAGATVPQGWLRRNRTGLVIAAAFLLAVGFAYLSASRANRDGYLDPDNHGPQGAQAVARVLADQGVDVDVVRDADALDAAPVDADTTVVVTSPENLGAGTASRLVAHAGDADVVIVGARFAIPGLVQGDDAVGYPRTLTVRGDCADPRFDRLELESRSGVAYPDTDGSCFGTANGSLLSRASVHTWLLGAEDVLENQQILSADNAAVALRLLGAHDRVVWYVPDVADLDGSDGVSLSSLLPDWLRPGLLLLAVALLGLVGWRFRRLGALATEPLPVTVTAIESTRSRGRLYRKANDRAHAAQALRRATAARLVTRLNLPRGTESRLDVLVRATADHTGREAPGLRALLDPAAAPPPTDRDLIVLANDLADLLREATR